MSQLTAFILIFCLLPLLFMALSYRGKIKGTLKGEENISEVLQVPEKMNISRYEGHRYTFEIHQYT